jgi:cytochrome c oxidase assembly protein subunit 11
MMRSAAPTGKKRRLAATAVPLVAIVLTMIGLSFASVPLYRLICQVTGIGGTPRTENVVNSGRLSERVVSVRFDANVNPAVPWRFEPAQREVKVRLGQDTLVYYVARNLADVPVTGTATFNVVPAKAAVYFNKVQCFCFTEQTLAPGQQVDMPVAFFIDPALDDDPDARDVTQFTLSYTFFRVPAAPATAAAGAAGSGPQPATGS